MFGLLDLLKLAAGAIVGGVIAWHAGHWAGERAGYERYAVEVARASAAAERERRRDDAEIRNLSDHDLCVAGLRGRGLPVDACFQLRGVREE